MIRQVLFILVSLAIAGCSNQWREATPDRTPEEVEQLLTEVQNAQGQGFAAGNLTSALQFRDEADIYFADAPSNVAQVANLVSFFSFDWLGGSAAGLSMGQISEARVFLLARYNGDQINTGLVIGLKAGNDFNYYSFDGLGDASDGEFVATLTGANSNILLRSYDVLDGELSDVIQLNVYQLDSGGNEIYLGKISTLIGYYK